MKIGRKPIKHQREKSLLVAPRGIDTLTINPALREKIGKKP